MNHNRCCAYDSPTSLPLSPLSIATASLLCPNLLAFSTSSASPLTVAFSKITFNPISTSNASLTLDITCVASSECPPSSKKSSPLLIPSTLNTLPQIPATISSTAVISSSSWLPSLPFSGAGSLFRSSFPFPVNGISSIHITALGTMYPGSLPFRYSRNSRSLPASLLSPAASPLPPPAPRLPSSLIPSLLP